VHPTIGRSLQRARVPAKPESFPNWGTKYSSHFSQAPCAAAMRARAYKNNQAIRIMKTALAKTLIAASIYLFWLNDFNHPMKIFLAGADCLLGDRILKAPIVLNSCFTNLNCLFYHYSIPISPWDALTKRSCATRKVIVDVYQPAETLPASG
jgi:hypothetical protein